ncbi:MAG: SDR family NAD(P)-dependent oxidoreductase [Polyangiales bacterium]
MRREEVILISGTSRGLGAHLRASLVAKGHVVYGSSRRADVSDAYELELDVTKPEDCQSAVAQVIEREGRVDALINNAASHLLGAAIETSEAELRGQLELNFFGAVHLTQAVLRSSMIARRSGRIINISSIGGRLATPFTSAYSASKFALEG